MKKKKLILWILSPILFISFYVFCNNQSSYSNTKNRIEFADRQWIVTDSHYTKISPGENYFSSNSRNVWVDEESKLHMKVCYDANLGAWTCAQVTTEEFAKYGTYSVIVEENLEQLDNNIVLGIFFYKYDPACSSSRAEIDLEFSKWGFPKQLESGEWVDIDSNSWYVLWDFWEDGETPTIQSTESFYLQMDNYHQSLHQIKWEDFYLSFKSFVFDPLKHEINDLNRYYPPYYEAEFFQDSFTDPEYIIPTEEDKMKLIMNLWIVSGETEPYHGEEVEVTLQLQYKEPGR